MNFFLLMPCPFKESFSLSFVNYLALGKTVEWFPGAFAVVFEFKVFRFILVAIQG